MRKSIVFLAISTIALSACGQSGSDQGGASDPGKAVEEMAFQFQPGQYRTVINIDKIEIPGLPPAALEQMKGMMGKGTNVEYCISPEQAAQGVEAMKQHMADGKCQFEKFEASGGSVESVMVCQGEGGSIRSTSKGTYTATGSVIKGVGDMQGPGGQKMHIEQTVTMERIGDCAK